MLPAQNRDPYAKKKNELKKQKKFCLEFNKYTILAEQNIFNMQAKLKEAIIIHIHYAFIYKMFQKPV